jgi:hypothetical protein
MKKIIFVLIALAMVLPGCSKKNITEKEFAVIWQEYLRREFEESFDEKQSIAQREKIFTELLSANNFTLEDFKSFMKKNHGDKFNKIFAE